MSKPERFKLPVGIFIMLRQGNKVLFQLRQNCSFSGHWGFVGGHLDGNETIVSAAIREGKEEIGIDILPQNLNLKTICHSLNGAEYLQFYFECSSWQGEIENKEPDRGARLDWFDLNDMPENVCPYLKDAVSHILKNNMFFEDQTYAN